MNEMRRMRPLLGTYVEIGVREATCPESAVASGFDAVAEIQHLLSFHDPDSDLSRLNHADGREIELHPHSIRVLRLARTMTHLSGGLFNCTVGGALVRCGVLPDHGAGAGLDCGDATDIELRGRQARLCRDVRVTLDGIAKGYAVDCAVCAMKRRGAAAGWVNAGGDLRVFGDLTLPVQRRELDGRLTTLGGLRQAALATSCVRAKHDATYPAWIVGASHLPRHGAWSVLASAAWRADALTKVASLASDAERSQLVARLDGRLVAGEEGGQACA
jgi:FAD:protein FMN transferase